MVSLGAQVATFGHLSSLPARPAHLLKKPPVARNAEGVEAVSERCRSHGNDLLGHIL